MTKEAFLLSLQKKFASLPRQEREERLTFYSEMIDDRMEEGLSEEEAVAAVGSIDETALEEKRKKPGRLALLVAGSPLWGSLLIVAFAVVISLVASFWALVGSACAGVVGGLLCAVLAFVDGYAASGMFFVGGSFVCVGLTILLFFAARESTKGMHWLTKKIFQWCKTCFSAKKEDAL